MTAPPVYGWCLEAGENGRRWLWPDTFSYRRRDPWRKFLERAGIRPDAPPAVRRKVAARKWQLRVVRVELRRCG